MSKNFNLKSVIFHKTFLFLVALLAVCGFAFALLATDIRRDLPNNYDPDEPIYWLWAMLIRSTGSAASEQGGGYPPGFLFLLIIEQVIIEAFRGQAIQDADYFLVARYVNITFAVAAVFLSGLSIRRIASSSFAGLLAALALSLNPVFISESRRAAANAPWMFFTLLCLWLTLAAYSRQSYKLFYASVIAGLISILFKYQSAPILLFPFWQTLRCYWQNKKQLVAHFSVMGMIGLLTLLWLIFGYHITEIVNTPASATRAVVDRQSIFEFTSFWSNFKLIYNELGKDSFLYTMIVGFLAMLGLSFWKKNKVDWHIIILTFAFYLAFHLLMSLFYGAASSKWLPVIAFLLFLWSIGISSISRLLAEVVGTALDKSSPYLNVTGTLVVIAFTALPYLRSNFEGWQSTIIYLRKPHTLVALGNWFMANVPEGGRTVVEGIHPFNQYSGFPGRKIYHAAVSDSLLDESIEAYRTRGYEFLIWTSLKSPKPDHLPDLESPKYREYFKNSQEIIRFTDGQYRGTDVVVFKILPIQQHIRYLWFTPAISFRGYDLNKESFKPGDDLELMFYWMSAERVKANYIVFVHVISVETGELLVGKDEPTDNGFHPTWTWGGDMQFIRDRHTLTIPATAKAGSYIVRFGMYDADTKARVQISTPKNEPVGDLVVLQEIRIEK